MRKGMPVARVRIAAYTKRFTRRRPRSIPGFKTGRLRCEVFLAAAAREGQNTGGRMMPAVRWLS
jgi:hypothetical protein